MPLPEEAYGVGQPIGLPRATEVKRAVKVEIDYEIRCKGTVDLRSRPGESKVCGKLLAELSGRPWQIRCARCGQVNRSSEAGRGPGN